jgi:inner membrane protein involved in colicin E2 resistance
MAFIQPFFIQPHALLALLPCLLTPCASFSAAFPSPATASHFQAAWNILGSLVNTFVSRNNILFLPAQLISSTTTEPDYYRILILLPPFRYATLLIGISFFPFFFFFFFLTLLR